MSRPLEYGPSIIKKAEEYLGNCVDDVEEQTIGMSSKGTELFKNKVKVRLPSKGGLAVYLDVARDTLYEWANKYPEFSDIMERLGAIQEERLMNNGLSGDYNPTITKVLLTKHGYKEGIEHGGEDGAPIKLDITKMLDKAYGE